jgi:hypothetical protein
MFLTIESDLTLDDAKQVEVRLYETYFMFLENQ